MQRALMRSRWACTTKLTVSVFLCAHAAQGKPSIPAVACAPSTSGRQHLQPHRGRGASAAAASALGGARSSSSSGGLHNGARRAELTYGESIVSKLVRALSSAQLEDDP